MRRDRHKRGGGAWVVVALAGVAVGASSPAWGQRGVNGGDAARSRAQPEAGADRPANPGEAPPETGRGDRTAPQGSAPAGPLGSTGKLTPGGPVSNRLRVEDVEPRPGALGPDDVELSAFSEGVELKLLVEYVADTLRINVAGTEALPGTVVLNAPVVVKRDQLLSLLDSLLAMQGYTITQDRTGWFFVSPTDQIPFNPAGFVGEERATTRLIPTPGVRPSSLQPAIDNQLAAAGKSGRLTYLDELGVILVTDAPRRIDSLTELVEIVLSRSSEKRFIRFELTHVAASVARDRVLVLVGQASPAAGLAGVAAQVQAAVQQQQQGGVGAGASASAGTLANLADRLVVDAQSNALIFRGFEDEADQVRQLLAVLDRPNQLEYRSYFAGTSAAQIAQLAQNRGLGAVELIDTTPASTTPQPGQGFAQGRQGAQQLNQAQLNQQLGLNGQQGSSAGGGPVMIVDQGKGMIIYYGTPQQQTQLASLIRVFDTQQDLVVIREYQIKNRSANDVADVLIGLISGGTGSDTSNPFLGGNNFQNQVNRAQGGNTGGARGGTGSTSTFGQNRNQQQQSVGGRGVSGSGRSPLGSSQQTGGAEVFVIADTGKNQVLVRAPVRQQEEFAKLITRLDQRRPQVYLDVQIVSVSADDSLRVTVESQIINADGAGGAANTNFGLGTLPGSTGTTVTGQPLTQQKIIGGNAAGLTAALIRSDQVPIVINAIKRVSQTRILSSPQLLVDDNEIAEIVSVDQQPTTTTTLGVNNQNNTVTFQGYEEAGTKLFVTPSISEGGYLRLQYEIELSNFVGTGSNGLPAPKQVRNVKSDSVTLPSDSTIVVGGIKVDANSKTTARVPLLGDIPLIGFLFGDTGKSQQTTRLYIFITPRIMRDQNFRDLLLLTRGPQGEAGVAEDIPPLRPAMIELLAGSSPDGEPATRAAPVEVGLPPVPASAPIAPAVTPTPAAGTSAGTTPSRPPPGAVRRRGKDGPSPDDE